MMMVMMMTIMMMICFRVNRWAVFMIPTLISGYTVQFGEING